MCRSCCACRAPTSCNTPPPTLLVPECGHAYSVLRWEAADLYGAPLPFEVMAVTEYLAQELHAGRLKLRSAALESATFQDPCRLSRKAGLQHAPRTLMHAMGIQLKEMQDHGAFSFCCGGGGGVVDIESAAPLRYRTVEGKLREIAATGAATLLTSCSDCRRTFDDATRHFAESDSDGGRSPPLRAAGNAGAASLLELIAEHLRSDENAA